MKLIFFVFVVAPVLNGMQHSGSGSSSSKNINGNEWKNMRRQFMIEWIFPLYAETVGRYTRQRERKGERASLKKYF